MSQLLVNAVQVELESEGYASLENGALVRTGTYPIGELAGAAIGVWGAEVGLIGSETTDEIFVVLEGSAEITFEDTGETIVVGPGDVVRLFAGQRNTWRTTQTLRKVSVYIPPAS
jgi:uncharacterized cupin superfamily protein